jgi:hypothetical protein
LLRLLRLLLFLLFLLLELLLAFRVEQHGAWAGLFGSGRYT